MTVLTTISSEQRELVSLVADMYGGGCQGCPDEVLDSVIYEVLRQTIEADEVVPTESIHVEVERGWVTLWGEVETWSAREHAEVAALETEGVAGVDDRLRVAAR